MMRPTPFWPSFDPCAKLTPVHVGDQDRADPDRRRLRPPAGAWKSVSVADELAR